MRIFIAFLFFFGVSMMSRAQQTVSKAYTCDFTEDSSSPQHLRMKEYFDVSQNIDLGKVDLMQGSDVLESSPTKVYKINLWEQQFYVQIWNGADIRVDAQMSLNGTNRHFSATYNKGSLQRQVFCTSLN